MKKSVGGLILLGFIIFTLINPVIMNKDMPSNNLAITITKLPSGDVEIEYFAFASIKIKINTDASRSLINSDIIYLIYRFSDYLRQSLELFYKFFGLLIPSGICFLDLEL